MNMMEISPQVVREFVNRWPVYARDRDNPCWMREEELVELKNRLIARQMQLLESFSPYYRGLFRREKINISRIKGVSDLRFIPPTFREAYLQKPLDFLLQPHQLSPEDTIYEITYTSGTTTGKPAPFFNTAFDMMAISLQMRRTAEIAWLTPIDTVFNLFPYANLPHIGFYRTIHLASSIGAKLVNSIIGKDLPGFPVHRTTDEAIELAERHGVSVISGISSTDRHFILRAQQLGSHLERVRIILALGEAVPERTREEMRTRMRALGAENVFINNGYGFTECQGIFVECCEFGGCHNPSPDLYHVEVLDQKTLEPAEEGELGLLAITHLNRRGTAVLRYVIGDLVAMEKGACPHCGRIGERLIVKVSSTYATRAAEAIQVEGQLVNPEVVKNEMNAVKGVLHYQLVLEKRDPKDKFSPDLLTIRISVAGRKRDHVQEEIIERILQATGIKVNVVFVQSPEIYDPSQTLKDTRVLDHRPD
jgi:phenylacetate-coenzyme A ligase PaaK-like adenylate-forming protein